MNEPSDDPIFLKASELAERWKVSVNTLTAWRASGIGPDWQFIGGNVRYYFESVKKLEAEGFEIKAEQA